MAPAATLKHTLPPPFFQPAFSSCTSSNKDSSKTDLALTFTHFKRTLWCIEEKRTPKSLRLLKLLTAGSTGYLTEHDCLSGWFAGWLSHCQASGCTEWAAGQFLDCLSGCWLTEWAAGYLLTCLADWLAVCPFGKLVVPAVSRARPLRPNRS